MDRKIAELAARQHGVVALHQLLEVGLSPRAAGRRVAAGRLHRIHPGVFAVGHSQISREGRWLAAVLAGGPGAALSHQAAGGHHGLRSWNGRPTITIPLARRSSSAIEFHRSALPPDEIAIVESIPTTTVPRTILDLASVLDRRGLAQAIREAEVRRLTDALSVPDLLRRHPGRRGSATLKAILAELEFGGGIPKRELEELFQRFVSDEGFPVPEINAAIHLGDRFIVADCLWRARRLIVELDGHDVHDRRIQSDSDKERDRDLLLLGWHVIRVTWRRLHEGRAKLANDLRRILGQGWDPPWRPGG